MEYEIGANESTSTAVVRTVSEVEARDPLDLPPLADVLDPSALDLLFVSDVFDEPRMGGRVSFVYSDSRASVENGEYLTIHPLFHRQNGSRLREDGSERHVSSHDHGQ